VLTEVPVELPASISLREVGPRDGLQGEAPLPVQARVRLVDALSATGVSRIEVGSFVSPWQGPARSSPPSAAGQG
jgi:hydroxymethylglutaryl-CoA lyase